MTRGRRDELKPPIDSIAALETYIISMRRRVSRRRVARSKRKVEQDTGGLHILERLLSELRLYGYPGDAVDWEVLDRARRHRSR